MRERSDTKAKTTDHRHWPLKFKIMRLMKKSLESAIARLQDAIYSTQNKIDNLQLSKLSNTPPGKVLWIRLYKERDEYVDAVEILRNYNNGRT